MSGGHFDYNQYIINEIAEEIENLIKNNKKKDDFGYSSDYSKETIKEFKKAIKLLKKSYIYISRIDWLVSGDDGQESFHERLKNDTNRLKGGD